MRFNGISIITDNYEEMVNFYKRLLQVDVQDEGVIALFKTKGGKFSICNTSVMSSMAPGCMKGAGNGSYTISPYFSLRTRLPRLSHSHLKGIQKSCSE